MAPKYLSDEFNSTLKKRLSQLVQYSYIRDKIKVFEDFISFIQTFLFTLVDNLIIYIKNESFKNFTIGIIKDEYYSNAVKKKKKKILTKE